VAGLDELGWDVTLLPLYTPIRVDEKDYSIDQIFFGGINVLLQQKIPLFRHLPAVLDRWLDNPKLIRRIASGAVSVSASELGSMTLSMVKGEHGYQSKEVKRLVLWLKELVKPDLICLTNLLVGGSIPALKRELGVPVLVTLQGDDVFLDELEEPWKEQVLSEMKDLAQQADGFITFSKYYQQHMSALLEISEARFHLTPLGVECQEFDPVFEIQKSRPREKVIGYFARLSPEKGLDLIVDAFIRLARSESDIQLHVGGWISEKDRDFFNQQLQKISEAGFEGRFRHIEAPEVAAKLEFFSEIDVFCVPARFVEPKGLYLLEAMACGLPVIAPDEGALSEMVNASGGGLLFSPKDVGSLTEVLSEMLADSETAMAFGQRGRAWVRREADQTAMAKATADVFQAVLAETQQG
tara:strand:- start:2907 stop:4139 length:1233 start_codon:yes stop_codon:yes gene_type:complete